MIKRIKITDFKSIRELDLTLDPVTVIVGRSGTGKSNFVQAIRFLRNLLLNPEKAVQYELGWDRIAPVGEKDPTTSIELTFSIPGEERDYVYRVGFATRPGHGRNMLCAESLHLGVEVIFSRRIQSPKIENGVKLSTHWAWEKAPDVAGRSPHHPDTPVLGTFPSLQKVVFAYAALINGIGYYHFPATVLSTPKQQSHGEEFLHSIPGLSDNAANYREVMRGIIQDFHHPDIRRNLLASLRAVNPSIASVELDSLINPQRAVVGHTAGGRVFDLALEQESDGLRRFYAHLLALYQTPPKLTLIFEEPENAIFPGALALLADEFKAAPRENRGQVIITTHSPMLLDRFDVDNIRVVEMQDGKTIIGPVSKEQREAVKERLLTTGELLTVDQPRTESAQAA